MTRDQALQTMQNLRDAINTLQREVTSRGGVCCGALYAEIADKTRLYNSLASKV